MVRAIFMRRKYWRTYMWFQNLLIWSMTYGPTQQSRDLSRPTHDLAIGIPSCIMGKGLLCQYIVLGNGYPYREKTSTSVIPLCHACVCMKSLQWCMTLCDTMDCSLPVSSVHGILQARILEWVVMPSSRESSRPRHSLPLSPWGSPPSPYIIFRN